MLSTRICMQSMFWKMGWLSWRESGMCRWPLHPHPALSEVTSALLCHESPLSWLTMLIQPKSFHAYAASQIFFFLGLYQYPWLLDFRGHHGSNNRIFICRVWMKFAKCLRSIIISLGLMYFLCVVSEIAKILGLEWGAPACSQDTAHLRSHRLFSLMPLCISKTCQHIIPSPA